jgi:hypothetical protein
MDVVLEGMRWIIEDTDAERTIRANNKGAGNAA